MVSVIPGGHEKESRVFKRTVNPVFQESFSFVVHQSQLKDKALQVIDLCITTSQNRSVYL